MNSKGLPLSFLAWLLSTQVAFSEVRPAIKPDGQKSVDLSVLQTSGDLYFSKFVQDALLENQAAPLKFEDVITRMKRKNPGTDLEIRNSQSRSLQKMTTSPSTPRRIFSFASPQDAPVFLGHVDQSSDMEILSWNYKNQEFDFLILEFSDSSDRSRPKLVLPQRKVCLECHQSGGPIFSRFPWSETITGDKKGFDRNVRFENKRLQSIQICKTACGSNSECKKNLFYLGLAGKDLLEVDERGYLLSDDPIELARFKQLTQLNWPKDGYSFVSSVIPDIDPRTQRIALSDETFYSPWNTMTFNEWKERLQTSPFFNLEKTLLPGLSTFQIQDDGESGPDGTSFGASLNANDPLQFSNPALPRPRVEAISALDLGLESLTTFETCVPLLSDELKNLRSLLGKEKLKLIAFDPSTSNVDNFDFPSREILISELVKRYPESQSIFFKKPPISPEDGTPAGTGNPLNLFEKNCSACHRSSLPLADPEAMKAYKNGLVLKRLTADPSNRMPPAYWFKALSEKERAQFDLDLNSMIKFLQ